MCLIGIFKRFSFSTKSSITILNYYDLSVINRGCTNNKIKRKDPKIEKFNFLDFEEYK